ncbi:gamma-glutamyltransferase [candidate division KSB1 bacterium]|nr:gamma-glutamyltransferase [candidate division KSB1 bacterium]
MIITAFRKRRSWGNFFCLAFIFLIGNLNSASRAPVRGTSGMVVSSHVLASEVGISILKQGGNAVDAVVAVGYALAVVFPNAGNLGGGGFMVIRLPDGTATAIDFREMAPQKAFRDMYLDSAGKFLPNLSTVGYLASGVPGSVAGLNYALQKYGSLPLKTILKPAIKLAEKGFPVSYHFHRDLVHLADKIKQLPATAKIFLKKDGLPYQENEKFVQKDLAKTLKTIASKGTAGFYTGKIAKLIAREMEKNRGLITLADLANYRPKERAPVKGEYKGYEIISMPPPSSGGIALIEFLNIIEPFAWDSSGFLSSRSIHLFSEAFRLVFADRAMHLGDPDFWKIPTNGLISKRYADNLRKKINLTIANKSEEIAAGNPLAYESNETTHYSVIDKNKMAVAVTTTLNGGYGSLVVIDGAGFLMNNEMDDFSAQPGTPNLFGLIGNEANAIEPGKRMLSSMTPTIVVKNNQPVLVLGAAGGPTIITAVAQIMLNVIEFGRNIQQAVDQPRIHHQWLPDQIYYENHGLVFDVLENLSSRRHKLVERPGTYSEANAILCSPETGIFWGAPDPRREAAAVGYD